jgi:signal transduction histidine kinase
MRLFFKLAIALSLVFAFLAGITTMVLQFTLTSGFQEIEDRISRENVQSVVKTIDSRLTSLLALAVDYGQWDETYEFVQGRNPGYAEEQVGFNTFQDLGVDAAYFLDAKGQVVWSNTTDSTFEDEIHEMKLPAKIRDSHALSPSEVAWTASGVFEAERGLVLVGASPILHNDATGPAVGIAIFVRIIDTEFLASIQEQTRYKASFFPLDAKGNCFESKLNSGAKGSEQFVALCKETASELTGWTYVHDTKGEPAAILKVEIPRDISQIGKSGFQYALVLLAIASFVAILTAGLMLQRIVTGPIGILSRTIQTVDCTGQLTTRSKLSSKDEIGTLSKNFDTMLDNLDAAHEELNSSKQAAEMANRAKSEFLAMMSHEIRTPLNGVIGMTEVLRQSNLTEKQHFMADIIESSGRNLLDILNNILDLSKLEAGRAELYEQAGDVHDIVESTVRAMLPTAEKGKVHLRTEIEDGVPTSFVCDVGKLQQVLRNYLGNALKFTLQGDVSVHVSMKQGSGGMGEMVCFLVKDTGIGIEPDAIKKLFNRFVQADSSTSREFGGTGLGLAICKELAILMGGEVGCESEVDKGSTFWIALPARDLEYGTLRLAEVQA